MKGASINKDRLRELLEEREWTVPELFHQMRNMGSSVSLFALNHIFYRDKESDARISTIWDLREVFELETLDEIITPPDRDRPEKRRR